MMSSAPFFVFFSSIFYTFLRFLHDANIHLFEIFCKSFDGKAQDI